MVCRSALSLVFSIRWYGIAILAVTSGLAATYPARSQAQVTGSIPSPGAALGSSGDLSLLREAISRAEAGDGAAASAKAERLSDPVARTLVEWFILRSGADGISANRVSRFLAANPGWPAEKTLRARAEAALLSEQNSPDDIIAFFRNGEPRTGSGRVVLADALRQRGQNDKAQALVREAWRNNAISSALERFVRERMPGVVTRADDKARMNRLFYQEDAGDGLAIGERLGGGDLALARARAAVIRKAPDARALLDAVPAEFHRDPGYLFARAQWLRRQDKPREAAQFLHTAPRDPRLLIDAEEWWIERRIIARKLLDEGEPREAYRVAAGHGSRKDTDIIEAEFHAGWIALRYLKDAATADRHFAIMQKEASRKISVARAHYWRARAKEALGDEGAARQHYEVAARHATTFYGQLAMAKLGRQTLQLVNTPQADEGKRAQFNRRPTVRAIRLLAAAGLVDKARPFFVDAGDEWTDAAELGLLARLAGELGQVKFQLAVGKQAVGRDMPLDTYAYPTNGVPQSPALGPKVERAVVLGLSRQESTFDPKIRSSAGAVGLMQMLPASAAQTARKYGVGWKPGQITDPVYNSQLGTAYLGDDIASFNGSYILAFAAYNAGRRRANEWIAKYGDPRDPSVDAIDWIERIPFSETRNYVMRVMENVQVYRARLGQPRLLIDSDLKRNGGVATAQTE